MAQVKVFYHRIGERNKWESTQKADSQHPLSMGIPFFPVLWYTTFDFLPKGCLALKRPLALCLPLCLCLLAGCSEQSYSRTIFAMDTVMELDAYGPHAQAGVAAANDEINRLEKLLSVTREDSEVWAVNHSGGTPVTVSDDTAALLREAIDVGNRSGGALDVTLYPVLRAWGFTTDSYQIPDEGTLSELLQRVDYTAVSLEGNTLNLPDGMELDFGALAKGYAGEQCARLMKEAGVTSGLLVLGGNVQTVGAKPDGSPWRVEVQDPGGETGDSLGLLELVDQAAVTSGGYQRYFEEDGIRYWHILDPATGAPARSGLVSVTIVGNSGTLCDALSTTLFVLGKDKALDYWRENPGFEALLVDEDRNIWLTGGLADSFTWNEDAGYTLQIVEE